MSKIRGWFYLGEGEEVEHTSKRENRFDEETLNVTTGHRQAFGVAVTRNRRKKEDAQEVDEEEDDDCVWTQEKRKSKRKVSVSSNYSADKSEAKLGRRIQKGREEVVDAAEGQHGREAWIKCIKASLLLSVVPEQVPCRQELGDQIFTTLCDRIRSNVSKFIYISGQPGTGKTLTVHRALDSILQMREQGALIPFKLVSINALNDLPTPETLFSRLYSDISSLRLSPKAAQALMAEKWFSLDSRPSPHYIVLLIDELDALLKHPKVLHTLMDWMARPASRLLVLGISNTIDLLERLGIESGLICGSLIRHSSLFLA